MKQGIVFFSSEPVDWSSLPLFEISEQVYPCDVPVLAQAQICRTEHAFVIRLQAQEPQIRAQEQGPLAMPCRDSCLEFFLSPTPSLRYLNFEWNPAGALYLGIGTGPADLMRIVPSPTQIKTLFSPEITQQEHWWQIIFTVPYTFIQKFFPDFFPDANQTIRGNFYKCGDNLDRPHYLAWSPITREGKYLFHTPMEFGVLHMKGRISK